MKTLATVIGLAAFLLNPNLACSGDGAEEAEAQYTFGAPEMKSVIEGEWKAELTYRNSSRDVRFKLAQVVAQRSVMNNPGVSPGTSLLRLAHACGDRSLIAPAAACITSSNMPLVGTYSAGNLFIGDKALWTISISPLDEKGDFRVIGLNMAPGNLTLRLGDFALSATVALDGSVSDARATLIGSDETAEVKLERFGP